MTLTDRQRHLLREAAKAYENMTDPFSTVWLAEHEVTFDECQWLSTMISMMIMALVPA